MLQRFSPMPNANEEILWGGGGVRFITVLARPPIMPNSVEADACAWHFRQEGIGPFWSAGSLELDLRLGGVARTACCSTTTTRRSTAAGRAACGTAATCLLVLGLEDLRIRLVEHVLGQLNVFMSSDYSASPASWLDAFLVAKMSLSSCDSGPMPKQCFTKHATISISFVGLASLPKWTPNKPIRSSS